MEQEPKNNTKIISLSEWSSLTSITKYRYSLQVCNLLGLQQSNSQSSPDEITKKMNFNGGVMAVDESTGEVCAYIQRTNLDMSINGVIDRVRLGRWVWTNPTAAISVLKESLKICKWTYGNSRVFAYTIISANNVEIYEKLLEFGAEKISTADLIGLTLNYEQLGYDGCNFKAFFV